MKGHLIHLFEYTRWANEAIAEALQKHGSTDDRAVTLMSHLIAAEEEWLTRLTGREKAGTSNAALWSALDIDALAGTAVASSDAWLAHLSSIEEADIKESVSYKNTAGTTYANSTKEIVTHIVNHSTYHRAQMAAEMCGANIDPPNTDYIQYVRLQSKG
jgi:uncharacterized damage-inducible protein DinB